jgi:hypothetical protein
MNYLPTFSKVLNKSLIIYNNNTKLIRSRTRNWEKKFIIEIKELTYEFLKFLETRRGWYFKWAFITFLASFGYNPLMFIFKKRKTEMLFTYSLIENLDCYQKENLKKNSTDKNYENKFMTAYWMNYL